MSAAIELEIHALLNEYGDPGLAADKLIQNLESSAENLNTENIRALAGFLWHCGYYSTLHDFVLRHINDEEFAIPWDYFGEALVKTHPTIPEAALAALREGIRATQGEAQISRSPEIDALIPEAAEWRRDRKYKIHKEHYKNKKNLLDQLVTLRTQQLYEQEKDLLDLMQKIYPGDEDVIAEMKEHQQRYALEILARRAPMARAALIAEPALEADQQLVLDEILVSMMEMALEDNSLAYDFAIAAWTFESYEVALDLLFLAPENESTIWFKLELLLKARRFLELLQDLTQVELHFAHEPETFFATAYLRAQALWGIGQKHTALEVLESLLAARPHYRAGNSLLAVWRGL